MATPPVPESAPAPTPGSAPAPLTLTHEPWAEPMTRPTMGTGADRHPRIGLTNRYVEVDGRPAIPVSGELHFSRVPRAEWPERLRLMRSGGVTVVATYLFWNHHEAEQGHPRFDGDLDVAAFVRTAADAGLDVVLRIGPWAHGEVRNGGFPDWVQDAPVRHRTDDPAYLALVDPWFAALGAQVAPLCGPAGHIVGIQLDNELYDQPGHLVTLKAIARRHGIVAPIHTATAWGGADLPAGEVLPLYGGYGDGFWVDADHPWDTTFREHFFFSHTWDDPGIGADLRDHPGIRLTPDTPRLPSSEFPAATCELGGGMATAYHRRPLLSGADIAAVAHTKIGNGSGWQGYYMFAGGTNPAPGLQETHATGYPNDLPEFDYDFHAPIGSAGQLAPSHTALRRQHAFLAAFGEQLAPMPSTLPDRRPVDVDDVDTLRWAVRSDGASGWLFLTWQQPHVPLPSATGVQFEVTLDAGPVRFPSAPIDVPPGTIAHWPIGLEVGGVRIDWATASTLTVLDGPVIDGPVIDGPVPTLVLVAEAGIPVEVATAAAVVGVGNGTDAGLDAGSLDIASPTDGVVRVEAGEPRVIRLASEGGPLDVLVLPASSADALWVLESSGRRRLVRSTDPVFEDAHGRLVVRATGTPDVSEYLPGERRFAAVEMSRAEVGGDADAAARAVAEAEVEDGVGVEVEAAGVGAGVTGLDLGTPITGEPVPAGYGSHHGRASAPSPDDVARYASTWSFRLPRPTGARRVLEIDWAGDVARLEVDGVVVADRFWDGTVWTIGLDALDLPDDASLVLRIVPMHPDAAIHLLADAAARRVGTSGALVALDAARLVESRLWGEREAESARG